MLYTDIKISTLIRMMISHSRKSDFLFWRISWRNRMLCCKNIIDSLSEIFR